MVFEPQGMFTEKAEVVLEVFGTFGVACGAVQQCFYAADAVFLGFCFFWFGIYFVGRLSSVFLLLLCF